MRTGIIIPTYNESASIAGVIAEIRSCMSDADIIVVNDGSQDNSAAVAIASGATVVSHPVNIGYGATVQTGLKYAMAKKYERVILLDGDGQHDPAFIPAMLQAAEQNNADLVIGSRFSADSGYRFPFMRRIGRDLFRMIIHICTGQGLTDITSGYKLLNARAVAFLAGNFPADFPDAQVLLSLLLGGFRIVEVPAAFRSRRQGQSMFSLSRKLYYPFKVLLAIFIVLLSQSHRQKQE